MVASPLLWRETPMLCRHHYINYERRCESSKFAPSLLATSPESRWELFAAPQGSVALSHTRAVSQFRVCVIRLLKGPTKDPVFEGRSQ